VLGCHLFGSVYLSDWVLGFSKYSGATLSLFVFAFLVLLVNAIPMGGIQYVGEAPVGIALFAFSLFLVMASFWFRLGVPFFSSSSLLSKGMAQSLISILIGGFALRYAWYMIHTREHHRWFSSALPTLVGLSLFLILLPGEQALSAFYCISVSLLFSFAFISHAFLSQDYKNKVSLIFSVTALVGLPPLILGEQFYRVIHDTVTAGNVLAGILMAVSWFVLTLGVTQKIAKIILMRAPSKTHRKIFPSEFFFLGIYLMCVISLTIFRVEFVTFLNEHPALNLW
jgi:hypothetical protein